MKFKQFVFGFLIFSFIASCSKKKEENLVEEFLIQIDSVVVPAQISRGELLPIQFYGTIGLDNSYQFDRIISETDSVKTSFMLIGKRNVKLPTTDSITQYLENISFQFYPIYPNDTNFAVIEVINPGYMNKTKYTVDIVKK
jgi:hypothetical protein